MEVKQKKEAIFIRVTPAEKAEIQAAARRDDRSTENWCRRLLLKLARDLNQFPPEAE